MNYLFLSGAPRSGTSVLTELICSHPQVALGMERFKYLYRKGSVKPSCFEPEYFFDFKKEQTNITSQSGKYSDYYAQLKKDFLSTTIRGDKYPHLHYFFSQLHENFGNKAKYIFIIRDIEEVASSFNVRAKKANDSWPAENDFKKAVEIWNESLVSAQEAYCKGLDIHTVYYKHLFDKTFNLTDSSLEAIFDHLELRCSTESYEFHAYLCKRYSKLIKEKQKTVLEGQNHYIKTYARYDLFDQLINA